MSEEGENAAKDAKYKRKRKKSFLKNARKYAKKGCYGRGSQLDADTYQYFVRILEVYREGFDNEDDKVIFVNNVFEQTVGQEINCCCNQVGCRVVEMLLPFASQEVLDRYMKGFSEDLRPMCSDRYASHVLDALVIQACKNSLKEESDFQAESKQFALKISKFLLNNLEDYIWDAYGNHVIRTCLENLAQISSETLQKDVIQVKKEDNECSKSLPDEYIEVIKDYGDRLIHWPQFNELVNSELTSGFLQVLLKTLRQIDLKLLKKYLKKLIDENFAPESGETDPNLLPTVFLAKAPMMLLETCLQVAKSKMFTQIYAKCFVGRLVKLASTRNTNFAVQKLLTYCHEKVEFEAIFEELKNNFKDIIEAGHSGVILALGQGCKIFAVKQGSYVQEIMKSLDCFEPEERQNQIVLCLAKFTNFNSLQSSNLQKDKLNLHGTLILQLMLEFNKPIKIVNSILKMKDNDLKNLFSNTMGSHIVDSYVQSDFVGEKSREKLVRKLKGSYQELASTKYGSRSFEAIWNVANLKNRLLIMEELSHKDAPWISSEFGKIIAFKINFNLFKKNKEEWKNSLNTAQKAKQLFADILS